MQVPWPSKKPQPEILTFRQPAVYNSATKHTEYYAQPPHRAAHELQRRAGRHPTPLSYRCSARRLRPCLLTCATSNELFDVDTPRPSAGSWACTASPSSVDVGCACGHSPVRSLASRGRAHARIISVPDGPNGGQGLRIGRAPWQLLGRARPIFVCPTAASRYSRAHGSCARSPPAVPTSATRPFGPTRTRVSGTSATAQGTHNCTPSQPKPGPNPTTNPNFDPNPNPHPTVP